MGLFGFRKGKIESKTESNLEEKVELGSSRTTNPLDRVKLAESFSNIDFSASRIWEYFTSNGRITKIGATSTWDDKIRGAPQMRHSDSGFYPVDARFEAEVDGSSYNVTFKPGSMGSFEIAIECDAGNVKRADKIFEHARNKSIVIEKTYESFEPFKNLFQYLKKNAASMEIKSQRGEDSPKMVIDERLGLLPSEARINARIDGADYAFSFSTRFRNSISVECPADKTGFADSLLEDIITKKQKEGEKQVKSLDFAVSVKEYGWDRVGGLGNVRKELEQYVEWPILNPSLFKRLDLNMPKGILLIGPPGNGKTTIAKILANTTNSSFYTVSPKDINSCWVGGTERNWGRLFSQARSDVEKGRSAIIFIDEVDGFYTNREDMDKYSRISFGQFCQEMEGISDLENVMILGATNRYEDLDPALIRPGRFTKKICIGNPDEQGRSEILGIYLKKKPVDNAVNISELANKTENYSGAMLKELCDAAAFNALESYCKTANISIKDIGDDAASRIRLGKGDFDKALGITPTSDK